MTFSGLITLIIDKILNPLVILFVALAVFYFLWGVLKYIQSAGDEKSRKEGISMMTYGIIALFVMTAVWGLVNVLTNTFPLQYTRPNPPTINSGTP